MVQQALGLNGMSVLSPHSLTKVGCLVSQTACRIDLGGSRRDEIDNAMRQCQLMLSTDREVNWQGYRRG